MQEFYIGQRFYYIDSKTHKKVYIRLTAYDDEYLYFKFPNGKRYSCKKYFVNKTVFVSLLEEQTIVKPKEKKYRTTRFWKHIETGRPGMQKDE